MKVGNKLNWLTVIAVVLFGGLLLSSQSAQAKGFIWLKTKDYSNQQLFYMAKEPGQSVAMWDAHHTRQLHNLKNYPHTKWSVTKSVKMYNPKKKYGKTTGIYYRLVNGKRYGYVHKNFVVAADLGGKAGGTNSLKMKQATSNTFTKVIRPLFKGTVTDKYLTGAAGVMETGYNTYKSADGIWDDVYGQLQQDSDKYFLKQVNGGHWNGVGSYASFVKKAFANSGLTLSQLKGWRIVVAAAPKTVQNEYYNRTRGDFMVFLLPPANQKPTQAEFDAAKQAWENEHDFYDSDM